MDVPKTTKTTRLQYLQKIRTPDSCFLLEISVAVNQLARLFAISCIYSFVKHFLYQSNYRYFGSLHVLLSLNIGLTISSPQIFLPARLGFSMNALFLSVKYLSIAFLHSFTDW